MFDLDLATLVSLAIAALGTGGLVALIQSCMMHHKTEVDADAIERQTSALEARIRQELTAENRQLRQEMQTMRNNHDRESRSMHREIASLKRQVEFYRAQQQSADARRAPGQILGLPSVTVTVQPTESATLSGERGTMAAGDSFGGTSAGGAQQQESTGTDGPPFGGEGGDNGDDEDGSGGLPDLLHPLRLFQRWNRRHDDPMVVTPDEEDHIP